MGYWLSLLDQDGGQDGARTGGGTVGGRGEERMDEEDAIVYVDILPWAHDSCCPAAPRAGTTRPGVCRETNNRPPSASSLIVHGLKGGGFHYAFQQTGRSAEAYDQAKCSADVFART